ncbi:hypothetical protein Mapa_004591 [Marchantia paleacea]|nr:hypothetical protein Mapa_004591 [Marchantia paleacea]
MAWRASYSVLLEIFPQVDSRMLKAAALDHGDDLLSAADFILDEVLGTDDEISDQEQENVLATDGLPSAIVSREPNAGEQSNPRNIAVSGRDPFISGAVRDPILNTENSVSTSVNSGSFTNDGSDSGQGEIEGIARSMTPFGANNERLEGTGDPVEDEAVRPVITCAFYESHCAHVDSSPLDGDKVEEFPQLCPKSDPEEKHIDRTDLDASSSEDVPFHASKDELAVEFECSMESCDVDSEIIGDEIRAFTTFTMSGSGAANAQGFLEERYKEENSDKVILESLCGGSTYTDPENLSMQDSSLGDQAGFEGEIIRNSVYDSILISGSTIEDETIVEGDGTDLVMASTKILLEEEDDMEGGCWETLSNSSTQIASIETILDAVDQAKADKEVLINSIEELRALRQETDQAEYEAQWYKDEAAKGGLDVMSRVDKMRQMLSQAREANEVHAAEVHGEKAVLATEARELRSRVVQLKREKEKALAVLNEIKASLQARINKAYQESEAAVAEKVLKEDLARECLNKEEELMAQVAQESRELHAETETCIKLREVLIESGNIVDALQGEVAVLCEDAEELKEEIERMSLSCSSGFVHMLKPRPLSDSTNSLLSKSSKTVGDRQAHSMESARQLDFPVEVHFAGSSPTISLVGGQRNASDKRLPSLRRALSGSCNGSQDLSGSCLSSFSSNGGASNSGGSSRIVAKLSASPNDGSKLPENKCSSPRSQCDSDSELKLCEAQFAMFPDGKSDLPDYRTTNLDIFRTETSRTAERRRGGSSDDDDWHLLEMTVRSKHTSSGSSSSSDA